MYREIEVIGRTDIPSINDPVAAEKVTHHTTKTSHLSIDRKITMSIAQEQEPGPPVSYQQPQTSNCDPQLVTDQYKTLTHPTIKRLFYSRETTQGYHAQLRVVVHPRTKYPTYNFIATQKQPQFPQR